MSKLLKWVLKAILCLVSGVAVLIAVFVILTGIRHHSISTRISNSDTAYVHIDGTKTEIQANDLFELKEVFVDFGREISEPICGFSEDYAVEFVNSQNGKSVIVCPALDKCSVFRINYKCYETSKQARADFESIVEKYGLTFPNI